MNKNYKEISLTKGLTYLKNRIKKIKINSRYPIFLSGETGTGKTHIAKYIHNVSGREGSFQSFDCSEFQNSDMATSKLFGYLKGAFTGAIKDQEGLIKLAENGTLFLDEVHNLTLDGQNRLIKALGERRYSPVGSNKEFHFKNVKIIVATNVDLKKLVDQNKFKLDLYNRIDYIKLEVKPLRERPDDIIEFTNSFIERENAENNCLKSITKNALNFLKHQQWKSNFRGLEGVLVSAYYDADNLITASVIIDVLKQKEVKFSSPEEKIINMGIKENLKPEEFRKLYLYLLLTKRPISEIAKDKKLSINHLYRIMRTIKRLQNNNDYCKRFRIANEAIKLNVDEKLYRVAYYQKWLDLCDGSVTRASKESQISRSQFYKYVL